MRNRPWDLKWQRLVPAGGRGHSLAVVWPNIAVLLLACLHFHWKECALLHLLRLLHLL